MRTKDEILSYARRDIQDDTQKGAAPLWLEVRKIEVLIDIRDIQKGILDYLATYYEDGIRPK
jgi:hypothetical protein